MQYSIRDFAPEDTAAVNAVSLDAFSEYQAAYSDWEAFSQTIGNMASLASFGELLVATVENDVVGAVANVGPDKPKADFFQPEWPILRMLVTKPAYRGRGIGRSLTLECVRRAKRDGASLIALHTSSIMQIALPMYQRMGFDYEREAPCIFEVPYAIYTKRFGPHSAGQHADHG